MFGFPREDRDGNRRPNISFRDVVPLEDRVVPALFANPDIYTAEAGRVLTVPATEGLLSNDFSDTNPGSVLNAKFVPFAKFYTAAGIPSVLGPVPANLFVPNAATPNNLINPDGSFSIAIPSADQIPPDAVSIQFSYTLSNGGLDVPVTGTVTINLSRQATHYIAAGADNTGGPHVRVYESGTGNLVYNFFPYEASFRGGVRVAVGDLNGDGIDDIATVPAAGGSARVRVFDGLDGAPLLDTFAFDPAFRGGGYLAIGDFNGNGSNDLIVGAGDGGGPRIQVFELNITPGVPPAPAKAVAGTISTLADFFAFDANTTSGVRVAAGDLENLDRDFIVATPGNGGTSQVKIFDGNQVLFRPVPIETRSFFADTGGNTGGVFLAVGDFRGDNQADIVTGTGSGIGIVRIYDGRNSGLLREFRIPVDETATSGGTTSGPSLFPLQVPIGGTLLSPAVSPSSLLGATAGNNQFCATIQGGARVAVTDWNGDGIDDIVVGAGPGNAPRIRILDTTDQTEFVNILAYSSTFLGGVNVGGA